MSLAAAQASGLPAAAYRPSPAPATVVTAASARGTGWAAGPRVQRYLGITAGSLASLVAVTGITAASAQSLPGDPFYGAKRAAESLELRTAGDDAARGALHFAFATTRLSEIRRLTAAPVALGGPAGAPGIAQADGSAGTAFGGSTAARVRAGLADMDSETREGSALLTAVFRQDGQLAPLRVITAFSARQGLELDALLPSLPFAARDLARASLGLVTQLGAQAQRNLAGPAAADPSPAGAPEPAAPGSSPVDPTPRGTAAPDPTSTTGSGPVGSSPRFSAAPRPQVLPAARPTHDPADLQPSPSSRPEPLPTPRPTGSGAPTPAPAVSPSPSPSPSPSGLPLPAPIPQPPPLPIPLPTGVPLPSTLVGRPQYRS